MPILMRSPLTLVLLAIAAACCFARRRSEHHYLSWLLPPESPCPGASESPGPKKKDTVRFVCISDTHNYHEGVHVGSLEGDVLLHAGDFSYYGTVEEVEDFARWFSSQKFKHKVLIAGNHDIGMDAAGFGEVGKTWRRKNSKPRNNDPKDVRGILAAYPDITYLENESIVVEGFKIYGSPMTPKINLPMMLRPFVKGPGRMAFNLMSRKEREAHWQTIPEDTDILLTHGPPYGFLDSLKLGDKVLRDRVMEVRPQFHIFGHIHESHGVKDHVYEGEGAGDPCTSPRTTFINAASVTIRYKPENKPVVFDIAKFQG